MGLLYGDSLQAFLIITIALAGGAAWMTGRAVANKWGPMWQALLSMLPLAAAARFLHFALGGGELLNLQFYLVDLAIISLVAAVSYKVAHTSLLARQYPWLYRKTSPFSIEEVSG